jgi:hypothetical protein
MKHAEIYQVGKAGIGFNVLNACIHLEGGGLATRVGACDDDAAYLRFNADIDRHWWPLAVLSL